MTVHGNSNEEEDRPLLSPASDARRPLDPPDRIDPDDIFGLEFQQVWSHLRSAKNSAEYHLAQYFERREVWARSKSAEPVPPLDQASSLGSTVPQTASALPRGLENFEETRENLVADLDYTGRLLDNISKRIHREIRVYDWIMASIVILAFASLFPWASKRTSRIIWGASGWPVLLFLGTRIYARDMRRCRLLVQQLGERAREDALTDNDRDSLDDKKFECLDRSFRESPV